MPLAEPHGPFWTADEKEPHPCQMTPEKRLALLAEGLPIILSSAQNLWRGAVKLHDEMPREAGVLEGFAQEEAAKALILMDAVRCPRRLIGARMGAIVNWSYDHLARLIYADAADWRPTCMAELREYVDRSRKAHALEGHYGEYIVQNWSLYERERRLYADIEADESGELTWSNPVDGVFSLRTRQSAPVSLQLTEAMAILGIFTVGGLEATSEIWDQVEFIDKEDRSDSLHLLRELRNRLILEGLPSDKATDQDVSILADFWQMPMYNLEFKMTAVSWEELEAAREEELRWAV